ncbi:hypothetical protein CS8_088250 [Cupriavidus sp. 8B]
MAFKKAVIERAWGAELGHHLGYPRRGAPGGPANHRNGKSAKTVLGPLRADIPRDRDGSFDPILIPKHEQRFTGFDDKIIAMYAGGMTAREIQAFLAEQYGTEVSPDLQGWQAHPDRHMMFRQLLSFLGSATQGGAASRCGHVFPALPEGTTTATAVIAANHVLTGVWIISPHRRRGRRFTVCWRRTHRKDCVCSVSSSRTPYSTGPAAVRPPTIA